MSLENIFLIFKNLAILIIVIMGANLVLRYLNKHMTKNNNIIKIVERISTDKDSSICIVMICHSYYLMSFSKEGHNILKDLDKDKVEELLKEKTKSYLEMGKKLE